MRDLSIISEDFVEKDLGKSSLVSRNITIMGRRTSVRLEPEMWASLREIAKRERCTIHDICSLVSVRKSPETSLTAAIRVFLMLYFRAATTEEGHARAGHGNFDFMKKRAKVAQLQNQQENSKFAVSVFRSQPINSSESAVSP